MKLVILAGGYGTRLAEETEMKPKPMVEIGGYPILWHIMKYYSTFGFNDFIILGGYKCYYIKEYFENYFIHQSDVIFDLKTNTKKIIHSKSEDWKVTVVDTGLETLTGGRLKRIHNFFHENECFCMTYGDGLSDVNISDLLNLHNKHNPLVTITAVNPPARFGALLLRGHKVTKFSEKPENKDSWINGGFFVLNEHAINYIDGDETSFEKDALEKIQANSEVIAYRHKGFWQPMDTLRDKLHLEKLWHHNKAPWKNW